MSESKVKISYLPTQRILRADFPLSECLTKENPPLEIITKAETKFEAEITLGRIDHFLIYQEKFHLFWQAARHFHLLSNPENESISFTLGLGGRKFSWLTLTPVTNKKTAFNITFTCSPSQLTNTRLEWLQLAVEIIRVESNYSDPGNPAQLHGAWVRGCRGESIKNLPIANNPQIDPKADQPYKIVGNKLRQEVSLIIQDHKIFINKKQLENLFKTCIDAIQKLSENSNVSYEFLKDNLTNHLKSAIKGPEKFGIGLPMVILIATGKEVSNNKSTPSNNKHENHSKENRTDLTIKINKNKMEAVVGSFNEELYKDHKFIPSIIYLNAEIKRNGIIFGVKSSFLEKIKIAMLQHKKIDGMLIAQGIPGHPSSSPYIYPVFRDRKTCNLIEETINIWDHNVSAVSAGDLVAEIRYKNPQKLGKNILGQQTDPEPPEKLVVHLGEGIEVINGNQYYATCEGMPELKKKTISISPIFVKKGNINLKSGNIYFEGPARIEGSIEAGATVQVSGDLTVYGDIGNALIRCGGSIIVNGGIVTSQEGWVEAKHDIKAGFAENSNILCGGSLHIERALINSNVIAGDSVIMNTEHGVLAGGEISTLHFIKTAKLGFPKGNKTILNVGVDWRVQRSLKIHKNRHAKIETANEMDRSKLRELIRKKKNQTTQKHKDLIQHLQYRLQKERSILDNLIEKIKKAKSKLVWNKDARIYVHDFLTKNIKATVGGNLIEIDYEVCEVVIVAEKHKDSHILPFSILDEAKKTTKSQIVC